MIDLGLLRLTNIKRVTTVGTPPRTQQRKGCWGRGELVRIGLPDREGSKGECWSRCIDGIFGREFK
jgi:hypothetical protein